MVRAITLIFVFLVALSPLSIGAHSGIWYVTAQNGTNLRTGPGTDYPVVELLAYGEDVKAKKHRGSWVYVRNGNNFGWVSEGNISQSKPARYSGIQTCFGNSWGQVVCAPQWIADTVYSAASTYGVSYWLLMSVAACESNYNPNTVGWAGEIGIFQFLPSTFYEYGSGDIYNTWDQAYSAARMFSQGMANHWTCYWRVA